MGDPVHELAHDHAELNERMLALASLVSQHDPNLLLDPLTELRELLFLHFAREEEGLFPFVTDTMPDLADRVQAMAVAHDAICGALARMVHLAETNGDPPTIVALYERFEHAYSQHAKSESELLRRLDAVLDAEQREKLAGLVEGL